MRSSAIPIIWQPCYTTMCVRTEHNSEPLRNS